MKNSTNKIIAAAVCGLVTGAVGISLINNGEEEFQAAGRMDDDFMMDGDNEHDFMMDDDDNEGSREEHGRGHHHEHEHEHGDDEEDKDSDKTEGIDVANGKYKDGTYSGSASGYSKGLKVDVTIANGKISEVKVVSHKETPGFCEKAIETIPAKIVEAQSTNIDTVSGATYSSKGIIKAVNDALKNASTNDSNNKPDNNSNSNSDNESNNNADSEQNVQ